MQGQWLPVLDHYLPVPLSCIINHFERRPVSDGRLSDLGSQEGMYIPHYMNLWEMIEWPGGNEYHPNVSELDRVSTYTWLDDYDTLFAARHGRGALDLAPWTSEQMIMTSSMGITPTTLSIGLMVNPLDKVKPPVTLNIQTRGNMLLWQKSLWNKELSHPIQK